MGGKGNEIGGGEELGLGEKNVGAGYGGAEEEAAAGPGICGTAAGEAPTAGDV
jgi:hypothetical protein